MEMESAWHSAWDSVIFFGLQNLTLLCIPRMNVHWGMGILWFNRRFWHVDAYGWEDSWEASMIIDGPPSPPPPPPQYQKCIYFSNCGPYYEKLVAIVYPCYIHMSPLWWDLPALKLWCFWIWHKDPRTHKKWNQKVFPYLNFNSKSPYQIASIFDM